MPGEYYHIFNRGNSKQKIFHDKEDYYYFIKLLHVLNQKYNKQLRERPQNPFIPNDNPLVSIGAYVIMPNHYHLLLTQTENGDVSKFMQKIGTGYAMYYNQKYNRTGSLFEGKFKSQHAYNDIYLKYLFSYIHLNPVKIINKNWREKGIKNVKATLDFLDSYKYSSYEDYAIDSNRPQCILLNKKVFPNYFSDGKRFQNEILEWINYQTTEVLPQ